MPENSPFSSSTAFCAKCGSILPLLQEFGSVKCYSCKTVYSADNYSNLKFQYTIHFNNLSSVTNENILNTDSPEGPVVERRCPKCGNDRMSYATLQLRSADEGQTVFYTCISCNVKGVAAGRHMINEATNLALKSSSALVTDFEQIDRYKETENS